MLAVASATTSPVIQSRVAAFAASTRPEVEQRATRVELRSIAETSGAPRALDTVADGGAGLVDRAPQTPLINRGDISRDSRVIARDGVGVGSGMVAEAQAAVANAAEAAAEALTGPVPQVRPADAPNSADDAETGGKSAPDAKTQADAPSEGGDEAGLSREEKELVERLVARDREVRAHENAHARVGGQYASQPSYDYQVGPDGRRYAIGGEVAIDVAPVQDDPEATITKMEIVKAAALAPAEPSAADRQIAALADSQRMQAIADLNQVRAESKAERMGDLDPAALVSDAEIDETYAQLSDPELEQSFSVLI